MFATGLGLSRVACACMLGRHNVSSRRACMLAGHAGHAGGRAAQFLVGTGRECSQ